MYADAALEYGFSPGGFMASEMYGHYFGHYEFQQIPTGAGAQSIDEFFSDLADCGSLVGPNMMQQSVISDYDLGLDGDLFKAPEPIISEPVSLPGFDPVTASAISIMSSTSAADIIADSIATSSIQTEQLLNDVFYECQKIEESQSLSELLDVKIPPMEAPVEGPVDELKEGEGPMQKSVSAGCLNSMEWGNVRPNFLDFQGMDFETVFGLRRAFSEGDIQDLGSNAMRIGSTGTNVNSGFEGLATINDLKSEERRQKLSRYRKKKIKRNFGRKIKYACRKALADSQPRVRGRFAKIEECEIPKAEKVTIQT